MTRYQFNHIAAFYHNQSQLAYASNNGAWGDIYDNLAKKYWALSTKELGQ